MAGTTGRLRRTIRRWRQARRGSLSVMTALLAVILFAAAGCAIDYIMYLQYRMKLQTVSDAAALGAVASARQAEEKGLGAAAAREAAMSTAQSIWNTNGAAAGLPEGNPPRIELTKSGDNWSATVDSPGLYKTSFMGLLGFDKMAVNGIARATTTVARKLDYWEYHIVIDTSGSMGIGATKEIMDRMFADRDMNLVDKGKSVSCQFACHDNSGDAWARNTVAVARAKGYALRIDVVDNAVDGMMNTMIAASRDTGNARAELWGLSGDARALVGLTSNLADIRDYDIQINPVPYSFGNTHLPRSLATLTSALGKSGDGTSPAAPRKAVFLVTDGVHDTKRAWHYGLSRVNTEMSNDLHVVGPMEAGLCDGLKRNGVTIGVLYIDYVRGMGDRGSGDAWVDPIRPYILPGLQGCASPGLFYNATTPEGIQKAMQDMLKGVIGSDPVRLSN